MFFFPRLACTHTLEMEQVEMTTDLQYKDIHYYLHLSTSLLSPSVLMAGEIRRIAALIERDQELITYIKHKFTTIDFKKGERMALLGYLLYNVSQYFMKSHWSYWMKFEFMQ